MSFHFSRYWPTLVMQGTLSSGGNLKISQDHPLMSQFFALLSPWYLCPRMILSPYVSSHWLRWDLQIVAINQLSSSCMDAWYGRLVSFGDWTTACCCQRHSSTAHVKLIQNNQYSGIQSRSCPNDRLEKLMAATKKTAEKYWWAQRRRQQQPDECRWLERSLRLWLTNKQHSYFVSISSNTNSIPPWTTWHQV